MIRDPDPTIDSQCHSPRVHQIRVHYPCPPGGIRDEVRLREGGCKGGRLRRQTWSDRDGSEDQKGDQERSRRPISAGYFLYICIQFHDLSPLTRRFRVHHSAMTTILCFYARYTGSAIPVPSPG